MKYINDVQAVFFDLDGTLVDTAEDLAVAANKVLTFHGKPTKPTHLIRPLIGGGTPKIIGETFGISQQSPDYKLIRQQLLQSYQQQLTSHSVLFPGIDEVLKLLAEYKVPWGIVTNKPQWLAEPIIAQLKFETAHHCIIGKDTLPMYKPHPLPLLQALQATKTPAAFSVYIGDAETDVLAAKRAGMQSIAAAYGYIPEDENPHNWNADHVITHARELIPWLSNRITAE